jgi:WD40 repeat protein
MTIVATSGYSNTITLWYPKTGKSRVLAQLAAGTGMYGLDFTPDSRTLIACVGYEIHLFDVDTGKELFGREAKKGS